MSINLFLDRCIFTAVSNGTGDFVVSAAVTGFQTPAAAGAADGQTYSYAAQSADLTQWEYGVGTYTVSTTTLARTTVTGNSAGGTSKINFINPPQVILSSSAGDLVGAVSGLTASSTQSAAGGTPITAKFNVFDTVTSSGDAATLPPAKPGMQIYIQNGAASNTMQIFAATQALGGVAAGDKIGAAATVINLGSSRASIIFSCGEVGFWGKTA